jgi:hypothetical protein
LFFDEFPVEIYYTKLWNCSSKSIFWSLKIVKLPPLAWNLRKRTFSRMKKLNNLCFLIEIQNWTLKFHIFDKNIKDLVVYNDSKWSFISLFFAGNLSTLFGNHPWKIELIKVSWSDAYFLNRCKLMRNRDTCYVQLFRPKNISFQRARCL